MLMKLCSKPRKAPIFVFVDAIDECEVSANNIHTAPRAVILFLGTLATTARRAHCNVNICISSRRNLTASTLQCAKIAIDRVDHGDIDRYVLSTTSQWQLDLNQKASISSNITKRSAGIFLWARLALQLIGQAIDDGLQADLPTILLQLPDKLETFYDEIVKKLSGGQQEKSLRLFRWALLAQRPLKLDEWFQIMAMIDMPDLCSSRMWERSMYGIETVDQLSKRVAIMSGGLLGVTTDTAIEENAHNEANMSTTSVNLTINRSVSAFAGSMDSVERGVPAIQFVHESVHEYFLHGNGFKLLDESHSCGSPGSGHVYIMEMCLRYAQLEELDWMVQEDSSSEGRPRAQRHESFSSHVSVASFGSSAASSVRRFPVSRDLSEPSDDYEIAPRLVKKYSADPHEEVDAWLKTVDRPASNVSPFHAAEHLRRHQSPSKDTPRNDELVLESVVENSPSSHGSPDSRSHCIPTTAVRYSYPALRLYVIDMFVHHALAAAAAGADVSNFLHSVEDDRSLRAKTGNGWSKWCSLNEGLRADTTPAYFAAENNLSSWAAWYTGDKTLLLNQTGGTMRFPLVAAVSRGHESVVLRLLPHVAAHARTLDEKGWTVMHHLAALDGGEATLSRLSDMLAAGQLSNMLQLRDWSNFMATPLDLLSRRATKSLSQRIQRISLDQPGDSSSPLDRLIHSAVNMCGGRRLLLPREDVVNPEPIMFPAGETQVCRVRVSLPSSSLYLRISELTWAELCDLLRDVHTSTPAYTLWAEYMCDLCGNFLGVEGGEHVSKRDTVVFFICAVWYSQREPADSSLHDTVPPFPAIELVQTNQDYQDVAKTLQ